MKSTRLLFDVCHACGRSSRARSSTPIRLQSSTRLHTNHNRLALRPLSTSSNHHIQPPSDLRPSEATSTPFPESMLPNSEPLATLTYSTPPSTTSQSTPTSTTSQSTPPNPYPPLPASSALPTFTGHVSHTHNLTAYITFTTRVLNKSFQTHYLRTSHRLVHDPLSLLRKGDVIRYSAFTPSETQYRQKKKDVLFDYLESKNIDMGRGERVTKKGFVVPEGKRLVMVGAKLQAINKRGRNSYPVKYIVREIVTPFGNSLGERMVEGQGDGGRKATWWRDMEIEREERRVERQTKKAKDNTVTGKKEQVEAQ